LAASKSPENFGFDAHESRFYGNFEAKAALRLSLAIGRGDSIREKSEGRRRAAFANLLRVMRSFECALR